MKKIEYMYKKFGFNGHYFCSDCLYFEKNKRNRYCKVYMEQMEEHSDWKDKYPACGLAPDKNHEKENIKIDSKGIEGQLSFLNISSLK